MTDWENIISFDSLYKAHRRARLGKRHKQEVILFENNLAENIYKMHYDLKYDRYEIGHYNSFTIYDPKEREIQVISYKNRVLQHSLCDNYLTPLLERHLIYDNTACRKGKGLSFAIRRFRNFMARHYRTNGRTGYFVKIDVKKYFDSIDHDRLKEKILPMISDENIRALIIKIIDSYHPDTNKGLPMGNQTSQCFALLYLDELDRYFKEQMRVKYYIRYMDDIVLIVTNKALAHECLAVSATILADNLLIINPKSQIIAVSCGVEFLGWRFDYSPTGRVLERLRHSTKRRILLKARTIIYHISIHRLRHEHIRYAMNSYNGFLGHGNAFYFLRRLSLILA